MPFICQIIHSLVDKLLNSYYQKEIEVTVDEKQGKMIYQYLTLSIYPISIIYVSIYLSSMHIPNIHQGQKVSSLQKWTE